MILTLTDVTAVRLAIRSNFILLVLLVTFSLLCLFLPFVSFSKLKKPGCFAGSDKIFFYEISQNTEEIFAALPFLGQTHS